MGNGEIRIAAASGGREITLDPIRELRLEVPAREVESTIPCGFQVEWGAGEMGGEEFCLTVGAGVGSPWLTFADLGKRYCLSAEDLVRAFIEAIGHGSS
jgi:hypothetical protein